jgi:hypothetical protein
MKCFHARRTGSAIAILVLLAFPRAPGRRGADAGAVAAGSTSADGPRRQHRRADHRRWRRVAGEQRGPDRRRWKFRILGSGDQVRFFAAGYQSARVESVKVTPDIAALVDIVLKPETAATAGEDVVEVVATAQKARESAQLVARQKADVVEDTIGAETFQKAPDSDAAEVVRVSPRSPSATTTSSSAASASATRPRC